MQAGLRRGAWIESRSDEIVLPGSDGELRFSGPAGRFVSLVCEKLASGVSVSRLRADAPAHLSQRLDEALSLLRLHGLISYEATSEARPIVLHGPGRWRERVAASLSQAAESRDHLLDDIPIHAVPRGNTVWIGPLGCAETRWSQIECRLPPFDGTAHDFAQPELVAAVLEIEAANRLRAAVPQVVAVHPNGTTSRHNVVPSQNARMDLSSEQALRWCTDPVTGVLRGVGETGLSQIFGVASKAVAAAPGPASAAVLTAFAVADDLTAARARACRRVLRRHIVSDLLLRRPAGTVIGVGSDLAEAAAQCLAEVSDGPRLSVPADRVREILATRSSPFRDFDQLLEADDRAWAVTQLGTDVPVLEFWLGRRSVGRFCTPAPERTVERGVEALLSVAAAGAPRERGQLVTSAHDEAPPWRAGRDAVAVLKEWATTVESCYETGDVVRRAAGVNCSVEVRLG